MPPLVIDALNLLTSYFLPVEETADDADAWTLLRVMEGRVGGFLHACENSKIDPHFVIDAGFSSVEAEAKWTARREDEVRDNARRVPHSAQTLFGDVLTAAGAKVYMVDRVDGDDVVATLAKELGDDAVILSADRDFFRYDFIHPKQVKSDFAFYFPNKGGSKDYAAAAIHLFPSPTGTAKDGVETRTWVEMPQYQPEKWREVYDKLWAGVNHSQEGGLIRGACSQETREFGNLTGVSKPLRLATYWAMGARMPVNERYPEWDADNDRVRWVTEAAQPDDALGHLLTDKFAALRWLTDADPCPGDGARGFCAFARHTIVGECFAAIERAETRRSVLSHVRELNGEDAECEGWESAESQLAFDALESPDAFGLPANRVLIKCAETGCKGGFIVTPGDRQLNASLQLENGETQSYLPTRCRECRDRRRKEKETFVSFRCAGKSCGVKFEVSQALLSHYTEKGFTPPSFCDKCRDRRKREMESQGGRSFGRGGRGFGSGRGRGRHMG